MRFVIFLLLLFLQSNTFAQEDFYSEKITTAVYARIVKEVEQEAIVFKKNLEKEDYISKDEVIFSVDTFKLAQINNKRQDLDFSTQAMNLSVRQMEKGYDKMLNKYYQLLLKKLTGADKQVLINAQKNWVMYKEAEIKLNAIIRKDTYSGGGTIQSNFYTGRNFEITESRLLELFRYWNSMSF